MTNVVVVDSGNIRRFNVEIYAELGEVLAGFRPVNSNATVVFDSIGMACQDIAAVRLVYDKITA